MTNPDDNPTERPPRRRVATIDISGDPNHRSPAPLPEVASAAPVATVDTSEEEDEAGVGTRPSTTPARLIRLGPWALPVCFFGGGARA